MNARLPLQVGRSALGQSTRFAATLWLGPLVAIVGMAIGGIIATGVGVAIGLAVLCVAIDAIDKASRDRPSDVVFDAEGVTIDGGELDGKRFPWAAVASCEVVDDEPRLAIRWWLISMLAAGQIGWLARRARVPVTRLQLPGGSDKPVVLAEAEGDERDSLLALRDAILGATAPHDAAAPVALPQEILRCPGCAAAQVPIDEPTMPCPYCAHTFEVPAELRERLRARRVLDTTAAPTARLVAQLVGQPGARWAARVVVWARRVMVWISPIGLIAVIAMLAHSTDTDGHHGMFRIRPSDDGVLFYDLGLLIGLVAATLTIVWTVGSVYLSNRRALRIVAEGFGAVPPIAPGAPSTCRRCNAPLPGAGDVLLVHCVYCGAENVLGVDPRPAAFRRARDQVNLGEALRHHRRARTRVALVVPIAALLGLAVVHEVVKAAYIPAALPNPDDLGGCFGRCGTITNADWVPRLVTWREDDDTARATVLPHGSIYFECAGQACRIDVGASEWTSAGIERGSLTALRIENGEIRAPADPP